ncbi:MAG: hypothetical protein HRU33_01550 [Rhodobacteraceae bacterium]|nr:hypothetical protein [Paracoccaceae bacterium]
MLLLSASLASLWPSTRAAWVFYRNPIVIEFLFGMAVAAGLIGLVGLQQTALPRFVAAGLPAMMVVAGGTLFCLRLAPARLLLRLGDASYSLYLSHRFTLRALALLVLPYLPAGPVAIWDFLLLAGASCLLVSLLVQHWIERPLRGAVARRSAHKGAGAA